MGSVYVPMTGAVRYGDHTADIWMSAEGSTPEIVIARMVEGLYGTISEAFVLDGFSGTMELILGPATLEELLVQLLSEILFLLDSGSEALIISGIVLGPSDSDGALTLSARGERYGVTIVPERRGMEVKAVTRHGTAFEKEGERWTAKVLLDI